jgi:hypothetical protein
MAPAAAAAAALPSCYTLARPPPLQAEREFAEQRMQADAAAGRSGRQSIIDQIQVSEAGWVGGRAYLVGVHSQLHPAWHALCTVR